MRENILLRVLYNTEYSRDGEALDVIVDSQGLIVFESWHYVGQPNIPLEEAIRHYLDKGLCINF